MASADRLAAARARLNLTQGRRHEDRLPLGILVPRQRPPGAYEPDGSIDDEQYARGGEAEQRE